MSNLKIYDSLKEVPSNFLKTIQAGRLKGMSDIKPQWRIMKLTEVFGSCGFGWKIQNVSFHYEKGHDNEIVCNCRLEFLYKKDGEWSDPIPATGGSKLTTMEKNGAYVSDEAEKMAYTDAISVATKMLGLASDVYMGYGGKYTQQQTQTQQPQQKPTLTKGKNFDAIIEKIKNKEANTEKVLQHYTVSEELLKELKSYE